MEIKNLKVIVLILLTVNCFGQMTKQDTLKMFEGHWVYKMANNAFYTKEELESEIKKTKSGKIHIFSNRFYGNIYHGEYDNYNVKIEGIMTEVGDDFYNIDYENIEKLSFEKSKIQHQPYLCIYYDNTVINAPYYSFTLLKKQDMIKIFWDYTRFFLARDKSEYKYIGTIGSRIFREDKSPTLNKILENEEVEILEKSEEYTKIRYWGKALIIGWVKTKDLKNGSSHPEYWNIYKENSIKFKVLSTKSFINDNLFQKTDSYLIKGDTIEVLEEKGFYLKIKYNNIIGFIPRIDVEGYNTFRITKSKATLHSSFSVPTKMYLLKGDDVELIDREGDWLKIRFRGKRVVDGWIKKSDVE